MRRLLPALVLLLLGAAPPEAVQRADDAFAAGDLPTALRLWSDALVDARERQDDALLFDLHLRLAAAHREANNPLTARRLLDAAEVRSPSQRARQQLAIGLLHRHEGALGAAEEAVHQAFLTAQQAGDVDLAATSALDLGIVRTDRRDLDGAERALRGSLQLREAPAAQVALAEVLLLRGQLSAARALAEAVRSTGGTTGADADSLLGRIAQAAHQPEQAQAHYERALATARSQRDVPRQASLLSRLATLSWESGQTAHAVDQWRAAETALRERGDEAGALRIALDRALTREDAAAVEALGPALSPYPPLLARALMFRAEHERSAPLAAQASELADEHHLVGVSWRADQLRGELLVQQGQPQQALPYLERAAQHVQQLRALQAASPEDVDAVSGSLADALLQADDPLGALGVVLADGRVAPELAAESQALDARATSATTDEARAELAQMRIAFAARVDTLRAEHPELDSRVRIPPEVLESVQADLPVGTLVLAPVVLDDRLILLTLTRERVHSVDVDLTRDALARRLGRLLRALRAGLVDDQGWAVSQGDTLGEALLLPIADQLEGIDTIALSPTGPLRQLPPGLLRLNGDWLDRDRAVVSITHTDALLGGSLPTVRGEGLLLLGNPDHTLPGAEAEVTALHARYPAADTLLGDAATRDQLTAHTAGRDVLHLATHGRIDPDVPERSHLVLAGGDQLAYGDIPGLAPWLTDTELVVLSACESGLPVQVQGTDDEGRVLISIDGLASQFRRAGVDTLLASLWKVDDAATTALMLHFYEQLAAGQDVHRALAAAQAEVRQTPGWEHPYFWAAWTLVGRWHVEGSPG